MISADSQGTQSKTTEGLVLLQGFIKDSAIGAELPEEIAISVVAQWLSCVLSLPANAFPWPIWAPT